MKRQPDSIEISILALFEIEPLNRHGAHRIDDILKQMSANSISYDDLAKILSDMIHAGWLVGRILQGPGGVAADIVDMDITPQGMEVASENNGGDVPCEVVPPETSAQSSSATQPQPPKCFISYSWDSEDHKAWVRQLAEGLRAYHVDAILDQWDVQPGTDLAHFMESAIRTDFVIVVCTPDYARKADEGEAGVGYEKRIITAKLRKLHPDDIAIIPVLRVAGTGSIPTFLADLAYLDFTSDADFRVRIEALVRTIFRQPACVPPPLGPMPKLSPAAPLYAPPSQGTMQVSPATTVSMPDGAADLWTPDLVPGLQASFSGQPFYAIWGWPTRAELPFPGTQDPLVRHVLDHPLGRVDVGFTLASATTRGNTVQEGYEFSSADEHLSLRDNGSMLFSAPLAPHFLDKHSNTIEPWPLSEYTLSFVQTYLALWRTATTDVEAMTSRVQNLACRLYLGNVGGWELRPGRPGSGGYGHLYDLFAGQKGLAAANLLVPRDDAIFFTTTDVADTVTLSLLKSVYSAFGHRVEDIPYFDAERLTFRF
jgi:hypothetical protein